MVSITPPADDVGIQSLKRENARTEEPKEVASAAAYPAVEETPDRVVPVIPRRPAPRPMPASDRRRSDRRRTSQRRQHQQSVVLDTRSKSERRKTLRRRADILVNQRRLLAQEESTQADIAIIGIDVTT